MFYKYFKVSVLLFCTIAGIWLFRSWQCGKSKEIIQVKYDTTYLTKVDTISVPYETLVPYKVTYTKEKILHDTLTSLEFIQTEADTAKILEQYFSTRFYSKTEDVQYGTVQINDTVTQNRITGRSIILTQEIPEVTKTVTIEKKRSVLFAGISALGNQKELPFATGVTLDLKTRNDLMIGVGGYFTNDERGLVGVSLKFPIRLKKR